jgi:hypothetical protein
MMRDNARHASKSHSETHSGKHSETHSGQLPNDQLQSDNPVSLSTEESRWGESNRGGMPVTQSKHVPSYVDCVAGVLSASSEPVNMEALIAHVQRQRPIGKDARNAIYRAVKQIYQAVPVAHGQYGWLTHLLQGSFFRHPLSTEEAGKGYLMLDELEHAVFFPQFFQTQRPESRRLSIELYGGETVAAEASIENKTWSLALGADFVEWVEEQGGQGQDDIIIYVKDAARGEYLLRLQPIEARDENAIRNRGIHLALAAEEIVTSSRRSKKAISPAELAALLIGRGLFRESIPPDDLHLALHKYSLLAAAMNGASGGVFTDIGLRENARFADERFLIDERPFLGKSAMDELIDDEDADGVDGEDCPAYEMYLENMRQFGEGKVLSHNDFHLLEAELETLIQLEQEFGYLLTDQQKRRDDLADLLFIDPESLRNEDGADDGDFDEPFGRLN